MPAAVLVLFACVLPAADGSSARTPTPWSTSFSCCAGEPSCGGTVSDPATCVALGELYGATHGASWTFADGWRAAAAGQATDYCSFYQAGCDHNGVLTELCVPLYRALLHLLTCSRLPPQLSAPWAPTSSAARFRPAWAA